MEDMGERIRSAQEEINASRSGDRSNRAGKIDRASQD